MDGFSLIVGGTLGILAGWAFSNASFKQRDANRKSKESLTNNEEIPPQKIEVTPSLENSLADFVQGFLLNVLGICIIIAMGVILFASMF